MGRPFLNPELVYYHGRYELRVTVKVAGRVVTFFACPKFQDQWIKEGELLAFNCELTSDDMETGRPVRAILRARLAVYWGVSWRSLQQTYRLHEVEAMDFALAVADRTVFEVYGAVPHEEDGTLILHNGADVTYLYDMFKWIKASVKHQNQGRRE